MLLLTRVSVGLQVYSGGSVGGAMLMNEQKADICLNWAGAGQHPFHLASGFIHWVHPHFSDARMT